MLTPVPPGSYVRPHNGPADRHLARFLAGDRNQLPEDIALVVQHGREAFIRTMLDRFGADPTIGHGAPWNPPTTTHDKANHTYSNSTVLFGPELESLRQEWLRNLRVLKGLLPPGKRPVTLLDYYGDGCFTTRMLRSLLEDFCGSEYGDFVGELRPSFDTGGTEPIKGDPERFIARVKNDTSAGGIIIAGGSFKSAYDLHGQFFQKKIMPLFINNPFNRGLMICWAYHVLMQTLAEMYGMDLAVLNGGLRWGTLPVKILNKNGPLTRMFNDAGCDRISLHSAVFTSTDHVVVGPDPRRPVPLGGKVMGSKLDSHWERRHVRVIASDAMTDQPSGFVLDDERFFGLAFHGEVLKGPHIETVQSHVVRAMSSVLEDSYGVSASAVAANFDPGLLSRSRQPRIEHDLGPALYLAILNRLTKSLVQDLKRSKRGR